MYKTDYFNIHESRYKKLKEQNMLGWGGEKTEKIVQ